MPTPFGLLLRGRLDGLKQDRTTGPGRPPRHEAKHNGKRPPGLEARSQLPEVGWLRRGDLPGTLEAKTAPRPAVRWTRYGYWNDGATAVYSAATGEVIYDTEIGPRRPRR